MSNPENKPPPPPPIPQAARCPLLPSDKEDDVIRDAQKLIEQNGQLKILSGPEGGIYLRHAKELQNVGMRKWPDMRRLLASAKVDSASVIPRQVQIKPADLSRELRKHEIDAFFFIVGDLAPVFGDGHDLRFVPITSDLLHRDLLLWNNYDPDFLNHGYQNDRINTLKC